MNEKTKISKYQVNQSDCVGCGLCAESCRWEAISLQSGSAYIRQDKCNGCGRCIDLCPQGAIIELKPVSITELHANIENLKQRANDIISRIDMLDSRSG